MRLATDVHLAEEYFLRLKLIKISDDDDDDDDNNNNNPILFLICGINRQMANYSNSTTYRQN
jgi:hypothetical protein